MKYRNDFVTNSSSSSFIIVFKNKEEMIKSKSEMFKFYSNYVVEDVFNQINKHKMTYTQVREYYKKRLEWIAYYEISYNKPEYRNMPYEWRESAEFKKLQKDYIKTELEIFDALVNHRGIFAVIEYSDHVDSTMEHEIVPNLPFVYTTISNH